MTSEELERLDSDAKPESPRIRTPAEYNAVIAGLSGAVGTSIANIAVYPIDLIVKRLQVQRAVQSSSTASESNDTGRGRSYDGFVDAARRIYQEEGGLSAFYSGCLQDTANSMASAFIYFLSYNFMRQRRLQAQARASPSNKSPRTLGVFEELSVGVLAGATAKLFTAPMANIVTRKQIAALHKPDPRLERHPDAPETSSVKGIVKSIYADRGLRGFWAGYDATLILTLNPATTFLLYETFKSLLPRRYRDRPTAGQTFILAAVAKAVASAAMYPISMAKSRSQVRRKIGGKSSIYGTLAEICRAGGIAAMYEGIWGEVLKGFFSNAMLPFFRATARRAAFASRIPTSPSTPSRFLPPRAPISISPPKSSPRFFHSSPPRPNRYQRAQYVRGHVFSALGRWYARPSFYVELTVLGGLAGSFYLYNIEEVPVSGRRRFNVISPSFEKELGEGQFEEIQKQFQKDILPETDPRVRQVQRVLARLIPHSGLPANYDWRVTVIDSEETNAFVIPGGKVFVFTGILPVCGNDDGLAAVLGHEIGHNVARHVAEQMSRGIFLVAAAWIVEMLWGVPGGFSQMLLQLAIDRPRSRAQEAEADYIGLLMMAKSCFDPRAAVTFCIWYIETMLTDNRWERMQVVEKKMGGAPPELLSTHPSSERRQTELAALLPKAYQAAMDSDCAVTNNYVSQFRKFTDDYLPF
ncbi:hypothetical protein Dda_1853 [Drechslerella dactyloides]|uniref:Peptidase M48 domain-containing protein n=1 Tax=Drechslerella dactyloides TaxID=74499 RepID=A0AAD6NL01_DREDA|nr:hypothetical protein Dda_1853 [Drechslerella dactyloides]